MPLALKNNCEKWTYADYLTWPDDERWEIIDGVAYAMSPSPGTRHQDISLHLTLQIGGHLDKKPCKAFAAPFDVRLSENQGASDNYVETVVQPDILVVCDKKNWTNVVVMGLRISLLKYHHYQPVRMILQ